LKSVLSGFASAAPVERLILILLLLVVITTCHQDGGKKDKSARSNVSGPAAAVQTTTYHGVGVVESINSKLPTIEINHEDIEGLMPAMRMDFYAKDQALLAGLKAGDRIAFTLENGVGGLKVTEITKL